MDIGKLIKQAKKIIKRAEYFPSGALAEGAELLRAYTGEKSGFLRQLNKVDPYRWTEDHIKDYVVETLEAFIEYVQSGLLEGVSIERKARIDVVSDFLDQANTLLNSEEVHPAVPTVIIGAALEEFLRNWIEEAALKLGGKKSGLDSYTRVLREANLISKQDVKDITSWGGLRNHAAHGEWDEVNDRNRISLMLEGVNLFMRKYGEHGS